MTRTVPPSRRNARSWSSAQMLRARAPHQQPHRLARAAQVRTKSRVRSVLTRAPVADHRPAIAIVDLLPSSPGAVVMTTRASAGAAPRRVRTKRRTLAVPRGEAVVVDQVLPDRDRVPSMPQGLDNQLAIRFAGAGTRRPGRRGACRGDRHRRTHRWFSQQRVGGHLHGNGRFCRPFAWPPATAHRDPGGPQIAASLSRGPHQWPPRSVAPASPSGRVQELVAASGDPRRSSFRRGTHGPVAFVNVSAAVS